MSSLTQSKRFLRLTLVGPCKSVSLAAPTLGHHLGISEKDAVARLSSHSGTLSNRLEASCAKRLAGLLSSLGVAVRLDPLQPRHTLFKPLEEVYDLSIQTFEVVNADKLVSAVLRVLSPNLWDEPTPNGETLKQSLVKPGGLILENLAVDEIARIRRGLRKISGLKLSTSLKATAIYDILRDQGASEPLPRDFAKCLRYLGLDACRLTGAVAAGVNERARDHLMKRFGHFGLVALNHEFQRFDLFLTGVRNVSPRELADFFVMRSELPRQVLERMECPLKIEVGLTRANALEFQSDYAALGVETCALLHAHHPSEVSETK